MFFPLQVCGIATGMESRCGPTRHLVGIRVCISVHLISLILGASEKKEAGLEAKVPEIKEEILPSWVST